MKYYKSNNNKKGGKLEINGILSKENFNRNTKPVELKEMNSQSNNKTKINPIKIMVKKKSFFKKFSSDEHYIFFGYDREKDTYEYVCYVNQEFSDYNPNSGLPITCEQRKDDGTIVKLTHDEFLNINIKELSILVYHLILRYKENPKFIDEKFHMYISMFILPKILEKSKAVNNKNLSDIVNKIKTIAGIKNKNNKNVNELPKRRTNQRRTNLTSKSE